MKYTQVALPQNLTLTLMNIQNLSKQRGQLL